MTQKEALTFSGETTPQSTNSSQTSPQFLTPEQYTTSTSESSAASSPTQTQQHSTSMQPPTSNLARLIAKKREQRKETKTTEQQPSTSQTFSQPTQSHTVIQPMPKVSKTGPQVANTTSRYGRERKQTQFFSGK